MEQAKIEHFLRLLGEIVNESSAFSDKRDALLAAASDEDRTNIYEFAGWFTEGEE